MSSRHDLISRLRAALVDATPRLARTVVRASTVAAQVRLKTLPRLRVLVDNTVLYHSITHETAWVSTGTSRWGPHDIETGYSARIPVRSADLDVREYRSIRYLAGIADLARQGRVDLLSSGELWVERLYQPAGRFSGFGYFDLDVFKDIEMPLVDQIPDMHGGAAWMGAPSIQQQRDERLARSTDPLYRSLLTQLGPTNSQDAWHIRTAEVNDMFCFLTMDFKLIRAVQAQAKSAAVRNLRTRVMTPEELGKHILLVPLNPAILSYDDASYPVRPDLHWPNSQRQKRTRKRVTDQR